MKRLIRNFLDPAVRLIVGATTARRDGGTRDGGTRSAATSSAAFSGAMYRRDAFASAGLTRAARWTRAELSQRDNSHQLLRRLLLVAAAGLLSAGALSAQQIEVNLGIAKYRNSLQQSGANPGSTAIFDGNIGKAGAASTPNDGAAHYLVRSSFGQPVQTALLRSPDFNFGAKIPAPAGASLAFAPTIDPAGGAFYLASEKQLIASGSGFTTIVWKDASGNPSVTSTYLISDLPSQPPVNIYWTEINQVATLAPPIDFPGLTVTIHYNSLILPEHLFLKGGSLRAQGRLGQAILEYRNSGTGAFVGLEVVKIKPYLPEVDAARDIGAYLAPKNPTANSPGRALLARGQNATPPYAYQHNHAGKVDDGILFATRETLAGEKLEVFWTEKRLNGVVWPYEMAEYTPAWPANFEDIARRIYQTHNSDGSITHAPAVVIPSSTVGNVVFHWNLAIPESLNPATGQSINLWLDQTRNLYAANQTGRILLHYLGATSDLIGVQLVRVKPYLPDVASGAFNIGDQLHPNVENAWDASVPTPFVSRGTEGTEDKNLLYQHPVAGPFQGNVYAIQKATDETKVEVFWKRRGLSNIEWLYEMRRYTADWPFKIPAKYQLYVRAPGPVFGPAVVIPSDKSANRMTFQEPPAHASDVSSSRFSTISAGWSLLRYRPTNGVSFQVVRSILHTDALVYNGQQPARAIGTEITEPTHQGPLVGYIHAPEGNKFDSQTHQGVTADRSANAPAWLNDWTTGQIFPVNTGPLEVWWSNLNQGVQWPSFVRRYDAQWLGVTDTIIIASQKGTGPIDQNLFKDFHYYYQNDPTLAGFNPNDEHALISGVDGGQGIFALRDDLGTAATSLPYTMLKYRNPANNQWRFRVYQVVAEKAPILFNYPGLAGNLIQPPAPLVDLCTSLDSGVSGPFWKDRKGQFWAKAAGDNGGTSQITMHWFYSASDDYYFPTGLHSRPTQCIPWLDQRPGGTAGVPTDVHYAIQWPTQVPTLNVGETLITDKKGLPVINGQCSVSVLYQQAAALGKGDSVALIDPLRELSVSLASVPGDAGAQQVRGRVVFGKLPPHLRERLTYDPINHLLKFTGILKQPAAGEPYLLPNIITKRDHDTLLDPTLTGSNASFRAALNSLATKAANAIVVQPGDPNVAGLALTAGFAAGEGYVTVAFGNDATQCAPASPVSVQIIKVGCPLYQGSIRVQTADSPFDEMLTLRFDGDLAGKSDNYVFEWKWLADNDGRQPPTPDQGAGWNDYPGGGVGAVDVTIRGAGRFTLSDNWFTCRYRPNAGTVDLCQAWSEWAPPQLAEGWIKRVISGINQYDQRFKDLGDPTKTLNTFVDMLTQAGKRWEGDVPLDVSNADKFGLIQIYETVFRRGISFSIDGTPPVDDPAVNKSLLLAATRLSDLYMLHGNEAFADAADPTIAVSPEYQEPASTIHAFMDQTASLLDEELNLLRGRDDRFAPGVEVTPVYNRMFWNFSGGDGEVAYALNYNIADATGKVDGLVDEEDAKIHYPNGHGDAWGHYLSAIKHHYRLLRNPNYTWVPKSEAVLIGGVPVTVDFQDERRFVRAAAAKARTGAEIVNLTYRNAFSANPDQQWRGYKDTISSKVSSKINQSEPRAWGVGDWASRAAQGAFLDWVVGNAIVPAEYQSSYRITDTTLSQLDGVAGYTLTDLILTNKIAGEAVGLSSNILVQLRSMPIHSWTSRGSFLNSLDAAIGIAARKSLQGVILKYALTSGLPERLFATLEVLKDNQYFSLALLRTALEKAVGKDVVAANFGTITPFIEAPPIDPPQGIQKVDRASVVELREVASILTRIQTEADKGDQGLTPLGLVKDMLPFDIDPVKIEQKISHFEQIYERAVTALNHAITVFNRANNSTQLLRKQADAQTQFQQNVTQGERDFQSRLVEIYGYPYPQDIGGAGAYPVGYTGADVYHYMYVDPSELIGADTGPTLQISTKVATFILDANGALTTSSNTITYNLSRDSFGLIKPAAWTGKRRAPGEIQMAQGDLLQAKARFDQGLDNYNSLVKQIEAQAELLTAQFNLTNRDILIQTKSVADSVTLNEAIRQARERQLGFETGARVATLISSAIAEALPKSLILGIASGGDLTSLARSAIHLGGAASAEILLQGANMEQLTQLDQQNVKEENQARASIAVTAAHVSFEAQAQLVALEQLVRSEAGARLDVYALQETMQQVGGRYTAALAQGVRALEDLLRFRQETAANVQQARYKDMAFRIFRNDALQKYRAQFDLAAAYVYMAARAYDFETSLSATDSRGSAREFLEDILRTRSIGAIVGGEPQEGSSDGDPGLADPMARMIANWQVLKSQLGFNNPQNEQNRFSLRRELFRIKDGFAGDTVWRETLSRHIVPNILNIPEFRRLALYESGQAAEPGIVIPFSQDGRSTTIETGVNFFGWKTAGGDSSYSSSSFSTKVRGVGLWFVNYNASGLANTPRVYLLPAGNDVFRSSSPAPVGTKRELRYWRVFDQVLPVPNANPGSLAKADWIPAVDELSGNFADVRRFSDFRAYHDSGSFSINELNLDSRLIGRSVWNTQWMLVIPASTLLSDRNEGLDRFINGKSVAGVRDGDGIKDILLLLQSYATPGR